MSRVLPPKKYEPGHKLKADTQTPTLHPIVVSIIDAPTFKWNRPHTPYLDSMRTRFDLDEVTAGARTEFDKVRALSHWTRTRWEHNGSNEARHTDPVGILEEAAAGQQFRCSEYAIVLSGALNAIGVPARVVSLKTADSETRASGAGHVVAEAYLRDAKRWVMVDGQWDVIPWVKGKPASALDLKKAIEAKSASITYTSLSGVNGAEYGRWIAPYLYYMDAKLDQRIGADPDSRILMLMPRGAHTPRVFQRKFPLKNVIYTTATQVFYPKMPAQPTKPVAAQSTMIPGRPLAVTVARAQPRTAG
jgi:hypothetical protein